MATIIATTRPITTFFQPVKSSEIENETVNGEEAEAEAWNLKTVSFFIPLFHFLRNVSEYALEVNICTFVVLVELSDFDVEVLGEGPVSSGVIEGKCCIEILFFFG